MCSVFSAKTCRLARPFTFSGARDSKAAEWQMMSAPWKDQGNSGCSAQIHVHPRLRQNDVMIRVDQQAGNS
jgi:hypothetical protein